MLSIFTETEKNSLVSIRKGETKAGQVVKLFPGSDWEQQLSLMPGVKYVLAGIPEDIGVRANQGIPGCAEMWSHFLKKILNVQSNDFFDWSKVLIAGAVEVSDLMKEAENLSEPGKTESLRKLTAEVDNRVASFTTKIIQAGKIPVIIGGGHNNSFGLLKGSSLALNKKINCLNIDPHADLRMQEGRHSGNGFTYALNENYLGKYMVAGLHENYNSSGIMENFYRHEDLRFVTYEQFLDEQENHWDKIVNFIGKENCGLEFDLDSIAGFPSSASTPSGFSMDEARKIIRFLSSRLDITYVHFAEGAPKAENADLWAKGLSYLVTDFLKCHSR